MRHQSRSSSNNRGDSMAWRSLRPLPCSTRIIMRFESTSQTFSATTSMARRPAPQATLSAALCLGPGAASAGATPLRARARAAACAVRRRTRDGVSSPAGRSVTLKKNRSAVTVALMLGIPLVYR
jgi:hypothetical protein